MFLECLAILGSVNQNELSSMKDDEQSLLEQKKDTENQIFIALSFASFANKSDPIIYLEKIMLI